MTNKIGEWSLQTGLKVNHTKLIPANDSGEKSFKTYNANLSSAGVPHLMVVTREEPPYVMVKCPNCTGKERYEGFAIDLLQAISEVLLGYGVLYVLNTCL